MTATLRDQPVSLVAELEEELQAELQKRERLTAEATPKNRSARLESGCLVEELRADIVQAQADVTAEKLAVGVKKEAEDRQAAGETSLLIDDHLERGAIALEQLGEHTAALKPLLRTLSAQLQPLGRRLPNRCLSGTQLSWAIISTVNKAWSGLLGALPPAQVRDRRFGELVATDIAAVLAVHADNGDE